jgi:hypothetical protein
VLKDDYWWSRAVENPSGVYPKTIAAMEATESSAFIPSAVEVAMQYRKLLVKRLKSGHAEFSKVYANQYQPKSLALLFSPVSRALGRLCVPLSGLYMSYWKATPKPYFCRRCLSRRCL